MLGLQPDKLSRVAGYHLSLQQFMAVVEKLAADLLRCCEVHELVSL